MTERTVTYTATIHDDSDGQWAEVAELPGVFATDPTLVSSLRRCGRESSSTYRLLDTRTGRGVSSTTE
ncbi:MAG: hypothetical protein ACREQ5_03095 [Candidatus Dormibacteria bacterium]